MNTPKLYFHIVDVFGKSKYTGNQLAVFQNCDHLTTEEMQNIAREINFSETTFILSKQENSDKYNVRIFTPNSELEFAGHPTLGTAWVIKNLIEKSDKNEYKLNLKVGTVPVHFNQKKEKEIGWMTQVQPMFGKTYSKKLLSEIINVPIESIDDYPIEEVSTGLHAIMIPLKDLKALKKVNINIEKYYKFIENTWAKTIYVFSKGSYNSDTDFSVRFFPINLGISEDPATGSAAGCLTAYLLKHNFINSNKINLTIEQGYSMNRISLLFIKGDLNDNKYDIKVGGKVFPIANGTWF